MKNIMKVVGACFLVVVCSLSLHAQSSLGIGIGLSTPNNAINSIYNTDNISDGSFIRQATKLGYNIGLKYRFALGENVRFLAGVSLHRFPETTITVTDPKTGNLLATITTVQNIIPINGGIEYALLNSFIGVYVTGDLSYNYFSNSADVKYAGSSFPLPGSGSYSRVGGGVGAGIDFDAKLVILDLNMKYNYANLIGKESGEPDKTFLSLTLSACFGSR